MRRSRPSHQPIVKDLWGDDWRVFERRGTPYGFTMLLGRPYPPPPVQGGSGGTRVIMTAPLAAHLRANARCPYKLPLPVGRGVIIRLRSLLGINHLAWDDTRLEWWMARIDDLATLTVPEFVDKHRANAWTRRGILSEPLVWNMRITLIGRYRRQLGWWKAPAVQKLLSSNLPAFVIADRLHISTERVAELRRKLRISKKRVRLVA